ncbi:MAG: helix-turn-helix domain-containing protein [Cytophagaceae bacterium]|nr:MAG: helix-turn-helix domain-containing protein [Cytophagaceae bacterium]
MKDFMMSEPYEDHRSGVKTSIHGIEATLGHSVLFAIGMTVYLTNQEMRAMRLLIINKTTGCTVDEIARVLGYEPSAKSRRVVQVHISNIRKKLISLTNSRDVVIFKSANKRYLLV